MLQLSRNLHRDGVSKALTALANRQATPAHLFAIPYA
jgi:hypothetical protein